MHAGAAIPLTGIVTSLLTLPMELFQILSKLTYQTSLFIAMSKSPSSAMATSENFAIHAQEDRVKLTHHNLK